MSELTVIVIGLAGWIISMLVAYCVGFLVGRMTAKDRKEQVQ